MVIRIKYIDYISLRRKKLSGRIFTIIEYVFHFFQLNYFSWLKKIFIVFLIFSTLEIYSQKIPDHNLLRGVAFSELQMHDSVIFYFAKAGEAMDLHPETHVIYGRSLLAKGQGTIAIQELLKAEKKETGLASFWLAKAFARSGDIEKALEYLRINLNSKYRVAESKILLDPDFQKFENTSEWKEFVRNTGNPSTLESILFEADYTLRSGRYTDALEIINEGLKRGLMKAPLHAKRADVYFAMGNHRMVTNDLSSAIGGDRRNASLYAKRGASYMKLERYKQALADYDQAIRLLPLNIQLYKERALANNKNGNYELAVDDLSFFLSYFPEDHDGWYQAGLIHFSNNRYLNSLESFNKALQLNNGISDYYAARGNAYMQTKTYRYAWNDFSMALDLNPVNPEVYLNKGIAAVNLGNMKDACYCFEMARRQGMYKAEEFFGRYCGGEVNGL